MISIPGRIPIYIFPFFWLLVFMIGWLNTASFFGTAIWAVVIFISILVHEYGHALTALSFGQQAEIHLVGLGGLTKREGPKLSRWQEFLIVMNGPIAGFLLCLLAYQLEGWAGEKRSIMVYALKVAVNVNLFWTIFNLLPVLPLDGGHLLRILLEGVFGIKGLQFTLLLSILLGTGLGFLSFFLQQIFIGALFFMLAFESYRAWANVKGVDPQDEDQHLQDLVQEGIEELKQGHQQKALSHFTLVRQQAPKGVLYVTATQYAARILAEQGHFKQAYDWLFPLQKRLPADYVRLLQQLAYRIQEWEQAVKIGQQAYQQEPALEIALINAFSYAIMGEATPAVGWLRCAMQLGLTDAQKIIEKREFDAIRYSVPFQNWLKNLGQETA